MGIKADYESFMVNLTVAQIFSHQLMKKKNEFSYSKYIAGDAN